MPEVVVVQQHKSNYPNPVVFGRGDTVVVGEKDTQYPGWVRVTDQEGSVGWAPLEYIEISEEGSVGLALKSYSAKELDVEPGDRLSLEYEHCDWCWVEHKTKGAGWVPKECLEKATLAPY